MRCIPRCQEGDDAKKLPQTQGLGSGLLGRHLPLGGFPPRPPPDLPPVVEGQPAP